MGLLVLTAWVTPGVQCSVLTTGLSVPYWDGASTWWGGWHSRAGQEQLAGIRVISILRSLYLAPSSPPGRGWGGADWLHSNSRAGMSGNLSAPVSARSTWRKWELRVVVFQSVFCHLYGILHVLHFKSRLCRNTEKFLHLQKYIFSQKKNITWDI